MANDYADVAKLLEKKNTFLQGLEQLGSLVQTSQGNANNLQQLFPAVQRSFTLLKARYTTPQAWKMGLQLYTLCQTSGFAIDHDAKLKVYRQECEEFLNKDDEEPPSTAQEINMLDIPGADPESHFDDAGPIVDDAERWRRAQLSGAATTSAQGAPAAEQQGREGSEGPRNARAELQRQILEGIEAVYSGMEAVARGTEAVERELESVMEMFGNSAANRRRAPPASKKAVAALPIIELTDEKLEELGPDSVCAVCTDEVKVGDKVQQLPCKHLFHPVCVAPWLSKHNSCPICRQELPTDDPHYEAQKERDAEEQEEQRGVANAVSSNEFMYI